jgi:hypothetical protein
MSTRKRNTKSSLQRTSPSKASAKSKKAKSADPPFGYLPRKRMLFVKGYTTFCFVFAVAAWVFILTLVKNSFSPRLPDSAYAVILLGASLGMFKYSLTLTGRLAAMTSYKDGFVSEGSPSLIFDGESALGYLAGLLLLTYELWAHWFHSLGIRSDLVAAGITICLWTSAVIWMLTIQVRLLPKPNATSPPDLATRSKELLDKAVAWTLTGMSASLGMLVILTTLGAIAQYPSVPFPWWLLLILLVPYLLLASLIRAAALNRGSMWIQISTPLLGQVIKRVCLFGAASSGVGGFLGCLIGLGIMALTHKRGSDALTLVGDAATIGAAVGSVIGVLALPKAAIQRQRELPTVEWLTHIRATDIDLPAGRWGSRSPRPQSQDRP